MLTLPEINSLLAPFQLLQTSSTTNAHDTLPIMIAALGMPIAGGLVDFLTFALARIAGPQLQQQSGNRDTQIAGMIALLYACAIPLSVLVLNAVTSAAIVA